MLSFPDWQVLLSLFTIAAALLAAGFGILGLTTKYKHEDGRLTRYGKFAISGFICSAFLSVSSQVIKDRIASEQAEKARRAADETRQREQDRYQTQIRQLIDANNKLQKLLGETQGLQTSMASSLAASKAIGASSNSILSSTVALQRQQRQTADRMLFSLWQTANRVSGASIRLSVRLGCQTAAGVGELRTLLDGASVSLSVTGANQFDRLAPHALRSIDPVIPQFVAWPTAIQLRATSPETTVHAKTGASGGYVVETIEFGPFFTETPLGGYESLELWRNAIVEMSMEKPDVARGRLKWVFKEIGNAEPVPGGPAEARTSAINCSVGFYLSVNGLLLAAPGGSLVYFQAGPDDGHGVLVAHSILSRTSGTAIPVFPGRRAP